MGKVITGDVASTSDIVDPNKVVATTDDQKKKEEEDKKKQDKEGF